LRFDNWHAKLNRKFFKIKYGYWEGQRWQCMR